jgi:FKBP-type peptidyl-prolyl cis-trans isomerase SlyD
MAIVYGIEYTVKNSKGEVVDSNKGQAPLEFVAGKGQIIPGLEKEVENMEVGEEKVVKVPASEAYGERNEELVETLPRDQFEGIELQKGMTLYGQSLDWHVVMVTVRDFDDKSVTIDYNHPLAGEDLTFDVKLVHKREATSKEALTGEIETHHCGSGECSCHH